MTQKTPIYTLTGTVSGGSTYIARKADIELLHYCREGEYAYVLSPRQLGKSSLMVRTASEIEKDDFQSVIIDLSELGITVTQQQWYLGLLSKLDEELKLKTSYIKWWDENAYVGETQRLVRFFQEVVLREVDKKIVVFIDEVDTTLRLKFTDDFFVAIRAMFNARAITPVFKRISFVLIGTASPTDFIKDPKRTPFNIGHRIELSDFSLDEAFPLVKELDKSPSHAKQILQWIFEWTNGHPYLTQNVSYILSREHRKIGREDVVAAVQERFLGHGEQLDDHLKHIRTMLFERTKDVRGVIRLYRQILKGEQIQDNEQSLIVSSLKLSGIVRVRDGYLKVSNKIYEGIFNIQWAENNSPQSRNTLSVIVSLASYIVILTVVALYFSQKLSSPVGLPAFLYNIFASATFPVFALIWLVIAIGYKSRRDALIFQLGNLLAKPIIFERDISGSLEFYPRVFFEAVSVAFRDSLYLPFKSIINAFTNFILMQAKLIYNPDKPMRVLGYGFFFISFVLFIYADAIAVANNLIVVGVLAPQIPSFLQHYEIAVAMSSLMCVVVSLLILGEIQSPFSMYSDWNEKGSSSRRLALFLTSLSLTLGIIVVLGLALLRLQTLQVLSNSKEISSFINLTFSFLVPLNSALAAALTFSDAMKGLFLLMICIQWIIVGAIYTLNYLLAGLGYVIPIILDYLYRLLYLVLSVVSYAIVTPLDVIINMIASPLRIFRE